MVDNVCSKRIKFTSFRFILKNLLTTLCFFSVVSAVPKVVFVVSEVEVLNLRFN